jgi:hypothetical protein
MVFGAFLFGIFGSYLMDIAVVVIIDWLMRNIILLMLMKFVKNTFGIRLYVNELLLKQVQEMIMDLNFMRITFLMMLEFSKSTQLIGEKILISLL